MRKLLIGGIALLATMLLHAEDTKVYSYNGKIDDTMNKITEGSPNVKAQDSGQQVADRENDQGVQQEKWNNLTDEQKHKIESDRMAKRDEARQHITDCLRDLNNESKKLSDDRAGGHGLEKDQYDHKMSIINQKQSALKDMETKLEQAPNGENVELDTPRLTMSEIQSQSRAR
jgi:hypothetical protein